MWSLLSRVQASNEVTSTRRDSQGAPRSIAAHTQLDGTDSESTRCPVCGAGSHSTAQAVSQDARRYPFYHGQLAVRTYVSSYAHMYPAVLVAMGSLVEASTLQN